MEEREAAAIGIDNLEHGIIVDTEFIPGKKPDVCPDGDSRSVLAKLDIQSGPVHVTSDQPVLASQRVQYYQTFNEVVARSAAQASSTSYFNWFDKASAGMAGDNVHLLNTSGTTARITVGLPGTAPVTLTLPSLAETYVTSAPGHIGGPVTVTSRR